MIINLLYTHIYVVCICITVIIVILLLLILVKQYAIIRNIDLRSDYTEKFAQAFHVPSVAGQWGETQLRRLVELAGMLEYCEFLLQNETKEGRPDMTIILPNKCTIYVDAKTPMSAYLKSIDDKVNAQKWLKENMKSVKNHINLLSKREYWKTGTGPELTIMFIPSESIWLSALSQDSSLIEYAALHNIIVTTPMTLIGLLKTIAYGWQNMIFTDDIKKTINLLKDFKHNNHEIQQIIESCMQINTKQQGKLNEIIKLLTKLNEIEN